VHLGWGRGGFGGGYAERVVARADALHPVPDGLDEGQAVAMIGTGRTTMGILEVAALTAGDVALVPSAAGGIGSLLVQAVVDAGGVAVGLAGGADKVALARELGAEVAVDYSEPGWPDAVREALDGREPTVAFDGVGGAVGRELLGLLGVGGRFILYGWSSGEPTELSVGDLYSGGLTASVAVGPRVLNRPGGVRSLEEAALSAAASGRLRPPVQRFPLADAAEAHAALEQRRTTGKVVLVP
jgi:NADPH2:quinone reductase